MSWLRGMLPLFKEKEMTIKLGDKGRDRITGFEGVCVSRTEYISGCTRVGLQPSIDKEGKIPDAQHFDEPMIDVAAPQTIKPMASDRGGPRPDPSHHKPVPR